MMANKIIGAKNVADNLLLIRNLSVNQNETRVKKLLLERISLSGICRVLDVSLTWLLDFIEQVYDRTDEQLNFSQVEFSEELEIICLEADELWSFVQNKANKQWIWLVA